MPPDPVRRRGGGRQRGGPGGRQSGALLEPQGILSIVLVPVFVDGRWWGFIGFDECSRERTWSPPRSTRCAPRASTLSAAVHRQRAEDQLREQQMQYRQVFEATGDAW